MAILCAVRDSYLGLILKITTLLISTQVTSLLAGGLAGWLTNLLAGW
jgi:hypothetical protein